MDDKLRIDYLSKHIDYKVVQHKDMYHFNTDTCLLGEFISIKKNDTVLDVGTNNGALLVYIIKKGGIATGIEINTKALEICQMTLKENKMTATLIDGDFTSYKFKEKFDCIVSNPPFFNDNQSNKNLNKAMARHEGNLTITNLCKALKDNLKDDGIIYLVYRPDRLVKLEEELNKNSLYINEIQYVYNKVKEKPKSILIKASFKKLTKIVLDNQYI